MTKTNFHPGTKPMRTKQTHIVIKVEDTQKYLSPNDLENLGTILNKISEGRSKEGKSIDEYAICNLDEPYSKEVIKVILEGERKKDEGNSMQKSLL